MKRKRRSSRRKNDGGKGVFRNCCIACALAAALSLAITSGGDESFDEHSAEIGSISETQSAAAAEERSAGAVEKIAGISEFGLGSSVITVSVKGEPVRMELEDYIVGVVAAEMPASSEPAALQAQAVAARTFTALHMAGGATCSHRSEGCTVCDDPACCQAYLCCAELEAAWGGSYSEKIAKIRAAVDSTRGMVVLYQGKPISALYHASSGRATENSEAVFAMALPYLVSVDSREGDNSKISMQEFDAAELVSIINAELPDADLSLPLKEGDIDVWGRTESGRVQLVQLGCTVVSGQRLRKLLGLKSTAFTVEISGDRVVFTCTGYGHGVGMSQYGANEMALEGYSFDEILLHFYTGTEIGMLRVEDEAG